MSNTCQHNLYICHCTPSSNDPSPIHPNSSRGTEFSLSSMASSSNGAITSCSTIAPLYLTPAVKATSVTSIRKYSHREKSTSLSSLSPERITMNSDTGYNTIPRVIVNANGHVRMTSNLGTSSIILSGPTEEIRFSPPMSEKCIKYQNFWQHPDSSITDGASRGCLERIVFVLLTMVLVVIFLVAALVFLYLGSSGMDSYSIVFSGETTGNVDIDHEDRHRNVLNVRNGGDFSLYSDNYGVEVVRVRNQEGKVKKLSWLYHRSQQKTLIRLFFSFNLD